MGIDSAEEFVRLRESTDPLDYRRAATESASVEVWLEVIESRPDMRIWVAQNKTVPLEILRVLARDADPLVRWTLAMKRKADPAVLITLAADSDDGVHSAVVRKPVSPIDALEILADDP